MNLNPKTICSVLSLPYINLSFKILSASCVFCTLGQYIDRHSPDVSADISTDTQPIQYVGWHIDRDVDRNIGRVSVDILTDYQLISRSI